ncbi:siderophore iron transporter mirb [Seiridium cupressi]
MTRPASAEIAAESKRDTNTGYNVTQMPGHIVKDSTNDNQSDLENPEGVEQVEAITKLWSKKMLWITLAFIWFLSFVVDMLSSVQDTLSPYITSYFSKHGLLANINIPSRIIGGVVLLPVSKIIDIRGRTEGFVGGIVLIVIGMVMKAACQNVETYVAAQVFYWVGKAALGFVLDVFVADITTLRNRIIMFTLNSTPVLATTFAGPEIAQLFYTHSNFRWAFGAWSIILLAFSVPVISILYLQERKAKKVGIVRQTSGRTSMQSLKHYLLQFDVVGMILIAAGFILFLLPFSLVSYSKAGWESPHIIVMIILGLLCLGAFLAWEKYLTPVHFFPFEVLKDRTVVNAALTHALMFMTIFIWNAYYSSYLQVVHGLSIRDSNYVLNGLALTSYFIGPFVGLYIRYTGHVKYPALASIPVYLLGTALIAYFRTPSAHVGYVAMCQILIGFGSALLTDTSRLAVMAAVAHKNMALSLVIHSLFTSIGSSIGYAIAGGMWTNMLPYKFAEYLPEDAKSQAWTIFGDITLQMKYPIGHPIRDAAIEAYGDVGRKMVIVGSSLTPLIIITVLFWRDINVKDLEQEEKEKRGTVF